jgi:hypothetical protein
MSWRVGVPLALSRQRSKFPCAKGTGGLVFYSFLGQLVRVTAQRVVEGAGNNTYNQQSTTKYLVEKHKVQQVSWLHGQLAGLAVVVQL